MNATKRILMAGMFFSSITAQAAELELEVNAAAQKSEGSYGASDPETISQRIAILRDAFNCCKGQKNRLTHEQLENLPSDTYENIGSFIHGDLKKVKSKLELIRSNTKALIPALLVMDTTEPTNGTLFQYMTEIEDDFNDSIKQHSKKRSDEDVLGRICCNNKAIGGQSSKKNLKNRNVPDNYVFAVFCNAENKFIYTLHPKYINSLLQLNEPQLQYIISLYNGLKSSFKFTTEQGTEINLRTY